MKLIKVWIIVFVIFSAYGCGPSVLSDANSRDSAGSSGQDGSSTSLHSASLSDLFSDSRVRSLAESAARGDVESVQEKVVNGVNVDYEGKGGVIPLYWPLKQGSLEGFEALLAAGADPNVTFWGTSIIHLAARKHDLRYLESVLQAGGDPNLQAGEFSKTPIFEVIGIDGPSGFEAMDVLIQHGASVEARTEGEMFGSRIGGKTPLLYAADQLRYDVVCWLLSHGADPEVKDVDDFGLRYRVEELSGRVEPGSQLEEDLQCVRDFLGL